MEAQGQPLRTAVYIDGYNLYYGRLRGSSYKWLDVVGLFRHIVHTIEPASCVQAVRYFTAPALAKFARHGEQSMQAQNEYHRALENAYPAVFRKILGSHVFDRDGTPMPRFVAGRPFNRNDSVHVWRIVEKKSDVNLAMRMYRDAVAGQFEQFILVSNDSDAEPVLEALTEDFPALRIGIVMPVRPPDPGRRGRPISVSLSRFAHWTRDYIRDDELAQFQLPESVPTRKKPARKPAHW
jgi:hypothetical protein